MRWGAGDAMVWDGDAPRRAPSLGSRFRENDDGGVRGRRVLMVAGGPSTGSGRTEAGGARAVGSGGVGDATRVGDGGAPPMPLWVPAFAGTTVGVCGPARAAGVGRGSRSGGTGDSRIAPTTGSGRVGDAMGVGGGCPARRTSGYRLSPVRRWGCGGRRVLLVSGGPPSSAHRTGFDRLRANGVGRRACGGDWGMRWWGTETHRAAPRPWVPAFARTTIGVWGLASAVGVGREVPLWRDGRFANRPYGGVACTRAGFLPARERHVREALRQAQGERIRESPLRRGWAREGGGMGGSRGMLTISAARKDGAAPKWGPPRMNSLVDLGPFGGLRACGCALFSSGSGPACRGPPVGRRGRTIAWVSAP